MTEKKRVAIYNPYLESKGGGEKVCLAMAEYLSRGYDVTLVSRKPVNLQELGDYFSLDLKNCRHYLLPKPSSLLVKVSARLHFPGRLRSLLHEHEDYKRLKREHYDIFVNNCYKSNMPCPSPQGIYMCMFPQEFIYKDRFGLIKRLYHLAVDVIEKILYGQTGLDLIHTYNVVTVNSAYTRHWTAKLWHIDPSEIDILYPICETMEPPLKKEKIILNVGRFFADSGENHYKCQDKLLKAFANMKELQNDGWRLHFVGSVAEDHESLKYLLSLIKLGQNRPVQFHFNASFTELKDLYQRASIYWHATGWGSDAEAHPEKQEHFGISTVEAMSAACVPIVYNSAGQKESVSNGANGYLWSNEDELVEATTRVARASAKELAELQQAAQKSSTRFGAQAFEKSVQAVFNKLPAREAA